MGAVRAWQRPTSRLAFHAHRRAVWTATSAGDLQGVCVIGPTPGIVWAHSVGGSCEADEVRGLNEVIKPRALRRTVLRLDLRGHGRSAGAHDPARGFEQYAWEQLAKDMRIASRASLSRAFFGGEGSGAAVALHAATAAAVSGSVDAPPGLVLMRPPAGIADDAADSAWRRRSLLAAAALEAGGWEALEALQCGAGGLLVGYDDPVSGAAVLAAQRSAVSVEVYAAALRGHAASVAPGDEVKALQKERHVGMAADAYGVPLTLTCPVLVLGVQGCGDAEYGAEAAEKVAARLPDATLIVAKDMAEARSTWAKEISEFLRKAWMKEFLTKRVMPQ